MESINNTKKSYLIKDDIKSVDICGLPKEIINIMRKNVCDDIINIIIEYYGIYIYDNHKMYKYYEKVKEKSINISTITLMVNFGKISIDYEKIFDYVNLDKNNLCLKKLGKKKEELSELDSLYNKYGKKKKKKKNDGVFYNQVTLILNTGDNLINIFIFKNGKIKLAGCEKELDIQKSLYFLLKLLKNTYIYHQNNNIIENIKFVDDIKNICISDIQINNIVSNFKLEEDIEYNRDILHEKLNEEKIPSTYESCKHSSVIIKKEYKNNKITTIIVFHTGSIIIMGSKTLKEVVCGYNFINNFIKKYNDDIVKTHKNDILSLLEKEL